MKKLLFIFLFIIPLFIIGCKTAESSDSENISNEEYSEDTESIEEYVFFKVEMNCDYSAFSTAHYVMEFHCKDLGDSYYEATSYKAHYFAASNSNGSTHNNNGLYRDKTESQLIEIIKQGTTVPDFTEKRISTTTISRTFTDPVAKKTVVVYIPEKTKYECCYYGITRK